MSHAAQAVTNASAPLAHMSGMCVLRACIRCSGTQPHTKTHARTYRNICPHMSRHMSAYVLHLPRSAYDIYPHMPHICKHTHHNTKTVHSLALNTYTCEGHIYSARINYNACTTHCIYTMHHTRTCIHRHTQTYIHTAQSSSQTCILTSHTYTHKPTLHAHAHIARINAPMHMQHAHAVCTMSLA